MVTLETNPYQNADWGSQQKAQFHTHTTHAPTGGHSGETDPHVTIDNYDAAGFDVLSLNEHEFNITETTYPWTGLTSLDGGSGYEDRDPAALNMVSVEGVENDQGAGPNNGSSHHMITLFSSVVTDSGAIEAVDADGGLSIIAHPAYNYDVSDWTWYQQFFDSYDSVIGVEVFNISGSNTDHKQVWDNLLEYYAPLQSVWAFGGDDYHGYDTDDFNTHYNYILTSDKTELGIRTALENGAFYAVAADSEGGPTPIIDNITVDRSAQTISITASNYTSIEWISSGTQIDTGPTLDYGSHESELRGSYVRAQLIGGSEATTQAWTFSEPIATIGDATLGDITFGV